MKMVKKIGGSYPWAGGGWGGLCEIFLTDLDPGYVVGEYELSRYSGEKVGRG